MRYWQLDPRTFGTSNDDVDLSLLEPTAVELTEQQWIDGTAALAAANTPPPPPAPVTTSLQGNGQSHATNASARRVTVQIIAPTGGPSRARPTVDGSPVAGGAGPFIYDRPRHAITIETRAGNNDVVILEEF